MSEIKQYVGFMMGSEHYGVDIMAVEEIIRSMDITPVPRAPSFVVGLINLRGRIIPVVDLRDRLKIPVAGASESMRIIVMKIDNRRLGFIVDKVEEVMHIAVNHIEEAPGVASRSHHYVEGVARTKKGMVILLDILKIFTPDEHLQMSNIR